MARMAFLACAAAASGLALLAGSSAVRAAECDDIVTALNKRMDEIRATRRDGDRLPTLCARMGRISGLSAAVSIVAEECFDAGSKRDQTTRSAADTESMLEIDTLCK
jgi:hypothetical protein